MLKLEAFTPTYTPPQWEKEAEWALQPFLTSLTAPVFSVRHNLPPELLGALFSRVSRVKGDLREILWKEYFQPILYPKEQTPEDLQLAQDLKGIIQFFHDHPNPPYNTKRARQFFTKWLAQYGDDSIAQMTSTNLVVVGLSQPALKFVQDMRQGIAPIEKSTRYVDYGVKGPHGYAYYTDPMLAEWGLQEEYQNIMDQLFEAYVQQLPVLVEQLQKLYPDEKVSVLEKKAFDVLRGFLPMSTLSQVAFHGNAQAFKYMIDRCAKHPLGELRWLAQAAREALDEEIPSLLLRLDDEVTQEYQAELQDRKARIEALAASNMPTRQPEALIEPQVKLVWADPKGEDKVITSLLFPFLTSYSWEETYALVCNWSIEQKEQALETHFQGRKARWQKVARALEMAYLHFEIVMNVGAYRDLHRHRIHTQDRQRFTTELGFEVPTEITEAGLQDLQSSLLVKVHNLFGKVAQHSKDIAQYVPTMFHFVRFYQFQNLRQAFWEIELRTGPQGRPDYRWIEQQKFLLLQQVYPRIAKHLQVDMNNYDLARRGTEEKAQAKEQDLNERLNQP